MSVILFAIGIMIGSFLNVCIYRIPHNKSVVRPRSSCLSCGSKLGILELIPVVSYCLLKGNCRHCGSSFSIRYPLVELLTGSLFLLSYMVFGTTLALLKAWLFICFLIVITFIDYDHQLILDKVLLWMAGSGVVIQLVLLPISSLWQPVTAGLAGGMVMLLIAVISRGGMGGGDIKFVAVLGLWLGTSKLILAMLLSFILGGVIGALLLLLRVKGRKDMIPFGPFLALGALISFLYSETLIALYWEKIL